MEEMCGFHSVSGYTVSPETNVISPTEYTGDLCTSVDHYQTFYGSDSLLPASASVVTEAVSVAATPEQILRHCRHRSNRQRDPNTNDNVDEDCHVDACDDIIKAKIISHPLYPKLLDASIDCRKLGAPPEVARLLEEIRRENGVCMRNGVVSTCLGADPELDEFMETYSQVLVKYKSDLARPFDEATVFLNNIETQLSNLCKEVTFTGYDELFTGDHATQSRPTDPISASETSRVHTVFELSPNFFNSLFPFTNMPLFTHSLIVIFHL